MAQPPTIRERTLAGEPFARGVQRGRMVRDTLVLPDQPHVTPRFVRACYDLTAGLYPCAADEFEGIVRGSGLERDALMAYYFARVAPISGCTLIGIAQGRRDEGTGALIGRNHDWATSDRKWCELHRVEPPGGPRRIGYTQHWAGYPDVLSETGLYVAVASLPALDVRAPGVQWNVLVDMISETCATVDEAVAVCARVRHLRSISYTIADARGAIRVVEATPQAVHVRAPQDGLLVATNAPLGGELLRDWAGQGAACELPEPIAVSSPRARGDVARRGTRRQRRAEALLRAVGPRLSRSDLVAALGDHEAPICVCPHSHPRGATWGTIWSGICEPATGRFAIAPGPPCWCDYVDFTL